MPPTPIVLGAVVLLVLIGLLAATGLRIISLARTVVVVVVVAAFVTPVGYLANQLQLAGPQDHGAGGSPERGQAFFRGQGTCFTCHTIQGISTASIGPELTHIATVAGTRKPGMAAEAYIRESIQNPTAFVAQGYAPLMPPNLASGQNLEDVVAFLITRE